MDKKTEELIRKSEEYVHKVAQAYTLAPITTLIGRAIMLQLQEVIEILKSKKTK